MASKRAIQQTDGHFNFWKEEELRAGNCDVKVGPGRSLRLSIHTSDCSRERDLLRV